MAEGSIETISEAQANEHHLSAFDFQKIGRTTGSLHVPLADGQMLALQMTYVRGGPGPIVLLTAGIHGDEFEGPITLLKLTRELQPNQLPGGGVIIMPMLNPRAIEAGVRRNPADGRDLNRCFPGSASGTESERIAHAVATAILPKAYCHLDMHAGGKAAVMMPSIMVHKLTNKARHEATQKMMRAFGAPAGITIKEFDTKGMIDLTAEKMGILFGCCELGGAAMTTPETLAVTDAGIRNVLKHFGIMRGARTIAKWNGLKKAGVYSAPSKRNYLISRSEGLFEPLVGLGQQVSKGQVIARIHAHSGRSQKPIEIRAPFAATIYLLQAYSRIQKNEWVAILASPVSSKANGSTKVVT